MVEDLLPDHIELPPILDLSVHLVHLMTWMGRGGHIRRLFPFEHFFLEHSFIVKLWGGWVAHVIIVSALPKS